jgi:hypothetical protein
MAITSVSATAPDQFGPNLVGLSTAGEPVGVVGEHRTRVAEPQRKRCRPQLAGGQPGHGDRALTDQREERAVAVAELEQPAALVGLQAEGQDLEVLQARGDHQAVAPAAHLGEDRLLGSPHSLRFLGEEVPKAGDVARAPGEAVSRGGEETSRAYPLRPC